MEGCVSAEGDPRRRNTYNRPRGHPYKNKSHLLGGRGSPAALFTQLWAGGLQDMHPTASTTHPWAPHGLRDKYGGPRAPRSHCGARGLQPAPRSPPVPQGPCLLPVQLVQGSIPGFKSLCPSPGAQPHSSGQPQGSGIMVLASEPGPTPLASPTGCPWAREPWSFAHALSLFFGGASLPLCGSVAPPPSPAGVAPVLASARGSGSAWGGRLASGGVRPLATG